MYKMRCLKYWIVSSTQLLGQTNLITWFLGLIFIYNWSLCTGYVCHYEMHCKSEI